jgi:hypothetical protein
MKLVSVTGAHGTHTPPRGTLSLRCTVFGPGKEDWNRGLREPRRVIIREARLSRCGDGSIRLHGFLGLDVVLDASSLDRVRRLGLKVASSDLEIAIDAASIERALAALPQPATVLAFSRRSLR